MLTFQTTTCSRCGGSGYMPFSVWGGRCFKCSGQGNVLTTNGKKAMTAYKDLLPKVEARKLSPGDRIINHDPFIGRQVVTVESVEKDEINTNNFWVKTNKCTLGSSPDEAYEIALSIEQKQEILQSLLPHPGIIEKE